MTNHQLDLILNYLNESEDEKSFKDKMDDQTKEYERLKGEGQKLDDEFKDLLGKI